ncbi:tRNA lysidine(34) synthetase TilS [Chitinophaga pendula]|uniref:tRNA lysidine(34) synthetase TilS n=1 Tax=Chitinophaga TaxID=79328 RepID=UPI000BAF3278|nr:MULTISPECIES: tRNA lysidine(34) synthetase TilS [Chitinophaga]ASZ13047.1 tRNA lysidine(34) synthetase TilS [Chitinophaga sp. MD30]UCJ09327.1 tRNA lysidine(34) synthetase TilS [Chitinophaga pendula]
MQQTAAVLLTAFNDYTLKENLFTPSQKILLAVSGGIDSVVMTDLFSKSGVSFAVAHCNFQLRQEESVRDETFVTQLARKYQVPLFKVNFDTDAYASEKRVSIQVAARELRYQWLEQVRKEAGYDYIATAHHMQDNVETVLMNFAKGTGISGMHGILPKSGRLIRPLLFAGKEDLIAYMGAYQLAYVEDSSNRTTKYTRNHFRHHVIPPILDAFPQAIGNMGASIDRMREAEILYDQAVARHKKQLLFRQGDTCMIPVLKLKKAVPLAAIAYEIFRAYGCSPAQVEQVLQLLDSESGKYVQTDSHRIVRNRQWLLIHAVNTSERPVTVIEQGDTAIVTPEGSLQLRIIPVTALDSIPREAEIACLDMKQVHFPLLLRKWKQGDYFYPLGMQKKKKLSRFFIDQKLSLPQKERTWIIETGKRIAWIAGMRIDDRFKVTPATTEVLLMEWKKA